EKSRQEAQGSDSIDPGLWDTTRTLLTAAAERRNALKAGKQPVTPLNEPRTPMTREERTQREQRATAERVESEKRIPAVYREDVSNLTDDVLSKRIRDAEQIQNTMRDEPGYAKSEVGQRRTQYLEKLRREQAKRGTEAKQPYQMSPDELRDAGLTRREANQ